MYCQARFATGRRVKAKCRVTALSAFPTFWHAIGIRTVCMAAGSWYSILPQHHGMPRYLRRLYGFVVYWSRDRRDVWSGFAYDVALADPIVSEVHSRLCTCMCECELRHFYASSLCTRKIRAIVHNISEIKIDYNCLSSHVREILS